MPSGESINNNSEKNGNSPKQINQKRGEMTVKAEREARTKALLEERAKLLEEIKQLREELKGYGIDTTTQSQDSAATAESDESIAENNQPATGQESDSQPNQETEPQASPEQITNNVNKAKKQRGFRGLITGIVALTAAATLAGTAGFALRNNKQNANKNQPLPTEYDQDAEDISIPDPAKEADIIAGNEANESERGIIDGYDQYGMWLSKNKSSDVAFASAGEVAEVCNDDEAEMIKYTAKNQVESFADYLANLPEQLQPEGFKNLSIIETEQRLEQLSDDDFARIQSQFDQTIDNAFTREVTLNGQYQNAYMRQKNAEGAVVHGNMELVECTTNEQNLTVTQFYWLDENGNEIGTMTVKIIRNEDGSISGCEQVVNAKGSKPHLYSNLESIKDPEPTHDTVIDPVPVPSNDTPSDTPSDTPPETPPVTPPITPPETPPKTPPETPPNTPKNEEAETKNAGEHVDQRSLDEKVTPSTTIQQDQENLEAIEKQRQADAAAQAEAERKAAEQAEAERQAAVEAEQRRQAEAAAREAEAEEARRAREAAEQAAAEAAARAQEEAAAAQRAAAEAERQAAAERAEREQAQREADARAAEEQAAAEAQAGDTQEQRAEDFANGNF